MKPILKKPPTFCRDCGSNTIDIFTQYGNPIGYFNIIKHTGNKSATMEEINKRKHLAYMQCSRCGKVYRIDWESDIPRPLYDTRIEDKIKSGTLFKNN